MFLEKTIELWVEELLTHLECDLEDPNFKETPARVSRMWAEMLLPQSVVLEKIQQVLSKAFPSDYTGIVLGKDIKTVSFCPHHMLPVEYTINVGYIPNEEKKLVLGVSKLARVAEVLSKRLVLQETLTSDIVTALSIIEPMGIVVQITGRHSCMRIRGVKQEGSIKTQEITGVFKEDPKVLSEFMGMLA